ncbi:MAG: LacI family DNA-binding transcriptional regulator [Devosia sp.]
MAEKTIRLADVAKAAGVSQGTASNVFSRPHLVREEVRDRVQATAKSLGYRGPDLRGRLLRAGKVNAIGVAAAEPLSYFFADPFAQVLMASIAEACDASGAGLALVSALSEERLAWNVDTALVDGLILVCIEGGARLIELARERRLPFVALVLGGSDQSIPAVGIDNFTAAQQAARHIAELEHRRVAILSLHNRVDDVEAADYADTRERLRGYLTALTEAGIDASTVAVRPTLNDVVRTRAALAEIFAADPRPTAILAMSDLVALTAVDWLKARGLRVPEDVSVIGFDGIVEGETSSPPLTTIVQPIAEIGRRAVAMILGNEEGRRREVLDVRLAVRGSTAPPPK